MFFPPAGPAFLGWAAQFPQITVHVAALPEAYGWNVKPQALLYLLDQGHDEIIWIDADVIIQKDFSKLFESLDRQSIAITEESLWGSPDDHDALRARLWGFEVGRAFPFTLNSAVIRVTAFHRHLLERWRAVLVSDAYRSFQSIPTADRPVHMMGDQDVLTALLSSKEFATVPVAFLLRGTHIIQFFGLYGYTLRERMTNMLVGLPYFVHSAGHKPWTNDWSAHSPRTLLVYMSSLYLDMSPYTLSAMAFRRELKLYSAAGCTRIRWAAKTFRLIGLYYPPIVGFPLAVCFDVIRLMKRLSKAHRR